ncbi:unnamed protein product [Linum tenue]|uniref:LOB domain-containing protein n=1 Tax=Linum tenue TaxID=586396 RepID=A0AAV0MBI4_9ROSI|nr:unnamed protein product [Linum tenue]
MERISCNNTINAAGKISISSNAAANHHDRHHQQQQNVVLSPITVPCDSSYNSPSPSPPSHHSSSSTSPTATAAAAAGGGFPSHRHHQQQQVILSPCAACKILRRRCVDKCVLAPYFPPTDPLKFTIAHRVFGASNIIKFLQELPESQRADAVSSMVYEAHARIRDPVYGCAGAICQLQKQIGELQAQLARAQAEAASMQTQQAHLVALIYMEMQTTPHHHHLQSSNNIDTACFLDESWEPLWT